MAVYTEAFADAAASKPNARPMNKCAGCGCAIETRAGKLRCRPCADEHYEKNRQARKRKAKP